MSTQPLSIAGIDDELSSSITEDIKKEQTDLRRLLGSMKVGLSVSDSDEFAQLGFSKVHQRDLTIELTRYLLVNGAHIVYGGDLRASGYTGVFTELAFQYRLRERQSEYYFTNFFSWPIHLSLKNSDLAYYKKNRVLPILVGVPKEVPDNLKKESIVGDTILNKYYWAKSLSYMRSEMINYCDARIVIGGKTAGYQGFYPGILEETFFAAQRGQRVFLVGAFGGAAKAIIRAILGDNPDKIAAEIVPQFSEVDLLHSYARQRDDVIESTSSILNFFSNLGIDGLSALNGLSKEENEIVFTTPYFHELIYYILSGLKRNV